jgi:hypothetical protein
MTDAVIRVHVASLADVAGAKTAAAAVMGAGDTLEIEVDPTATASVPATAFQDRKPPIGSRSARRQR